MNEKFVSLGSNGENPCSIHDEGFGLPGGEVSVG